MGISQDDKHGFICIYGNLHLGESEGTFTSKMTTPRASDGFRSRSFCPGGTLRESWANLFGLGHLVHDGHLEDQFLRHGFLHGATNIPLGGPPQILSRMSHQTWMIINVNRTFSDPYGTTVLKVKKGILIIFTKVGL